MCGWYQKSPGSGVLCDVHDVVERLARFGERAEHVVAGRFGRGDEPVEVHVDVVHVALAVQERIGNVHDDRVAGFDADRRRHADLSL